MVVSDLKQLAALTALNHMMTKGHMDICTVRNVGEILRVDPKQDQEAYAILQSLHCVDFGKMPAELREAIPDLVQRCLGVSPIYEFKTTRPDVRVIDVTSEPPKKSGFLRLLGASR